MQLLDLSLALADCAIVSGDYEAQIREFLELLRDLYFVRRSYGPLD